MIGEDVSIYDLETKTFGKPDSSKDIMKVFGCYSYKYKKCYVLKDKEQIKKFINVHKFMVGFNNIGTRIRQGYDNPILIREGFDLKYKMFLDLQNLFEDRANQMKIKKGMLGDLLMEYTLDYITRMLGLVDDNTAKEKIDYDIFKKDTWTKEEWIMINKYTKRDIEITKKLYEWVENYFKGFKQFLNKEDIRKKVYLTARLPKVAYKAICKAMNWEDTYGKHVEGEKSISGGYVAFPASEKFEGDIYCLDFNSLYPHIMIQCNLYGRQKEIKIGEEPGWNGGGVWKVNGSYRTDKICGVSLLLKNWYNERLKLKKIKDPGEYSLKIILNMTYGILDNSYYEKVCDKIAAQDCTMLGRQWTKYARKIFREKEYINCYTDTDSVYVKDPFNNKEKLMKVVKEIIDYIKSTVPFPQDTFDMGIDDEIKYMFFFKGKIKDEQHHEIDPDDFINKPKGLIKKNYIYVTKDNKVVIKNLGIRKKSNSLLSRKIFWDYLVPKVKEGEIKFSKTYIRNLIMELLQKDIKLACMRRNVGNYDQYPSKTSIQAQIARKYGSGIHFLIPITKGIGVGKGKKFCKLHEFNKQKLKIDDIDLLNVWSELSYFIKPVIVKNIFDYEEKK